MPEGEYLFSHVGFSPEGAPHLILERNGALHRLDPLHQTLTLSFDTTQRFCRGWHDLATGQDTPCPDTLTIGEKYEQCAACQSRTGFNPAFYHAKTISPQQQARNSEPHLLYLAYFADNVIKVGISHAKRGHARLLEQGARSAAILEVFPNADIARQYEERIAALPGIYETLQLSKKIGLLATPHNNTSAEKALLAAQETIKDLLGVSFTNSEMKHFDDVYFPRTQPALSSAHHCQDHIISGTVTGMLGSLLLCQYQDTPVFLPLKKYIGYKVVISPQETQLDIPAQQISLF